MNRGVWVIAVGLAVMAGASGCIFNPFGQRLRRAQEQVLGLNQRITTLERAGLLGSAADAPIGSISADDFPALIETSQPILGQTVLPGASQWPGFSLDWRRAFGKLLRGVVNMVTGWVEVPKRMHETTEQSGPGSGFTLGLLRGLGYGFVRTAAGAYDTVTFAVPAPPGYRPVMQPIYVFVCEHGLGNSAPQSHEAESSSSLRCPVGGEWLPATTRYCPEHGVEIGGS